MDEYYLRTVQTGELGLAGTKWKNREHWLGRAINLNDSPEKVVLHLLLGEPSLEKMRSAYTKAENILNKIPMEKVFVREHEAKKFSESLGLGVK